MSLSFLVLYSRRTTPFSSATINTASSAVAACGFVTKSLASTPSEIVGRGFESYIATPFDREMKDSTCVFCGSCVQVCPTAALMPVSRNGKGREWELDRV